MNKQIETILRQADEARDKRGDLKKARQILEQGLRKIKGKDSVSLKLRLGSVYRDLGKPKEALKFYQQALVLAKQFRLILARADALRLIGYLQLELGKWPLAKIVGFVKPAVLIVGKKNKREYWMMGANVYALLGNVYANIKLQDFKKARENYLKGLKMARRAGFKGREITILNDIATVDLAQNKFGVAIKRFLEIKRKAKKSYRKTLPAVLLRLGNAYNNLENKNRDPKKALKCYIESWEVACKEGWKREEADALEALGDWYWMRAMGVYEKLGHRQSVERVRRKLGYKI